MGEVKTAKAKRVVIQYPEGVDIDPRSTAEVTLPEVVIVGGDEGIAVNQDSEGDLQVDVKTMPSISVAVEEKGFSDAYDTPTRALVDSDRHVQADVNNFPSEYPLPSSQVSSLKTVSVDNFPTDYAKDDTLSSELTRVVKGDQGVIKQVSSSDLRLDTLAEVSNFPSDYPDNALHNALASVATDKLRTSVVDALPAGTNKIGSVDVDNFPTDYAKDSTVSSELTRAVKREGSIHHFSVSASGAGSTTIYTPSSGKAVQVLGWSFYCDADVVCELRFTSSGNVIAGLPVKGAHATNMVGLTPLQGSTDETVEIYVSGAANVKGWICYKEI